MNSTAFDWNTKLQDAFDRLYPSVGSSFSSAHTREILIIIGLSTICLLIFILFIQFLMKIRDTYRTFEPRRKYKKSYKYQTIYPSYQELAISNNNRCKCRQSTCLPKMYCIKPSKSHMLNQSMYYEQVDERQINSSICRVFTPSNDRSSIHIHRIK